MKIIQKIRTVVRKRTKRSNKVLLETKVLLERFEEFFSPEN